MVIISKLSQSCKSHCKYCNSEYFELALDPSVPVIPLFCHHCGNYHGSVWQEDWKALGVLPILHKLPIIPPEFQRNAVRGVK
jgi:hypothetical protein